MKKKNKIYDSNSTNKEIYKVGKNHSRLTSGFEHSNFQKNKDNVNDQEKIEERLKMLKELKQKAEAVEFARERYMKKSNIYKFFHRNLTYERAGKMTISEIDNLYSGVQKKKVMSK